MFSRLKLYSWSFPFFCASWFYPVFAGLYLSSNVDKMYNKLYFSFSVFHGWIISSVVVLLCSWSTTRRSILYHVLSTSMEEARFETLAGAASHSPLHCSLHSFMKPGGGRIFLAHTQNSFTPTTTNHRELSRGPVRVMTVDRPTGRKTWKNGWNFPGWIFLCVCRMCLVSMKDRGEMYFQGETC